MSGRKKRLSKSKFIYGLQCPKRLYLELHHRELASPPTAMEEAVFYRGTAVGELARKEFPDGILVDADYRQPEKALKDTKKLLHTPHTVLFEPAFLFNDIFVRLDILIPPKAGEPDPGWSILEVKSSTSVSEVYIADVAVQRYVAESSGLGIKNCGIMYLNRECTFPDLSNLFSVVNVNTQVERVWPELLPKVEEFRKLLKKTEVPDVPIGKHCNTPYTCPFKEHCWKDIPSPSIYSIPRISWDKIQTLTSKDILSLDDVPQDFPLTSKQQRFLRVHRTGIPEIDITRIREKLSELEYPIYFLDFETEMEAIPRLTGLHPYESYPFQFSLHILDSSGELSHREYLHMDETDPRPMIAEKLELFIGEKGTIVAYNAPFEIGVLRKLAQRFPSLRDSLTAMTDRFFDLLLLFRNYYHHPGFGGSNSIKSVLPVLVPELSYAHLEIGAGDMAQIMWEKLLTQKGKKAKEKIAEQLKEYCSLDTFAMVKLYQVLKVL